MCKILFRLRSPLKSSGIRIFQPFRLQIKKYFVPNFNYYLSSYFIQLTIMHIVFLYLSRLGNLSIFLDFLRKRDFMSSDFLESLKIQCRLKYSMTLNYFENIFSRFLFFLKSFDRRLWGPLMGSKIAQQYQAILFTPCYTSQGYYGGEFKNIYTNNQ